MAESLLDRLKRLKDHQVSRNALWILIGQGANFFLQAAFFLLLTRLLGVTEYGVFSGAYALINLATPYSSLGAGMLFMRYVTEDHSKAGLYWGNTLVLTTTVTLAIATIFYFAGPAINHTQSHVIFFVLAIANCLFSQVSDLGSIVFQTFEKMRYTATLSFLSNLGRVLVLLIMLATLHKATAVQWSIGIFIASGLAAVMCCIWVRREIGPLSIDLGLIRRRLLEGFGFSFAGTTQNAYNDIDKTMLSHYGLNRENGFYSLAYRIVDFATTPIIAIDSAVLPRFFKKSRQEMSATIRPGVPLRSRLGRDWRSDRRLSPAGGAVRAASGTQEFFQRDGGLTVVVLASRVAGDPSPHWRRPDRIRQARLSDCVAVHRCGNQLPAQSLVDPDLRMDRRGLGECRGRWGTGSFQLRVIARGLV